MARLLGELTHSTLRICPPGQPQCFVAIPYDSEFDVVFETIQCTLESTPYNWRVIRAKDDVRTPELLGNVVQHIEESRRYVADVSLMNSNVLMELGMMLSRDRDAVLLLADEKTARELPVDIRGIVNLTYPARLRADRDGFKRFFQHDLVQFSKYLALKGQGPSSKV